MFSLIGPVSPVRAPFSVAARGEKRVALGVRVDIRPLNTRGKIERPPNRSAKQDAWR
ncbi:hypothetical protein [Burkholderia dolosa]|uniref:hypothetical protein n=1 Tax=Burkholderia dolosa TaxID=152500 RepID=UPI001B8F5A2C|nr:hypothetical protein [Burkholderia dolosa]MBR8056412.1 hypothetical protein [Burkholderia dolosa]MBY4830462.1 hypothetical protein [Burkholderia dolosa]